MPAKASNLEGALLWVGLFRRGVFKDESEKIAYRSE